MKLAKAIKVIEEAAEKTVRTQQNTNFLRIRGGTRLTNIRFRVKFICIKYQRFTKTCLSAAILSMQNTVCTYYDACKDLPEED